MSIKLKNTDRLPGSIGVLINSSVSLCLSGWSRDYLKDQLLLHSQGEWCSKPRLDGLMVCMSRIVDRTSSSRNGEIRLDGAYARDFVSALSRPKSPGTLREPVDVLKTVSFLHETAPALFTPYQKAPPRFRIPNAARKKISKQQIEISSKRYCRLQKIEAKRMSRRCKANPWYPQFAEDLKHVSLSAEGMKLTETLLMDDDKRPCTSRVLDLVDQKAYQSPNFDSYGSIWTPINNCPKELKPHLLINNEPVALCDITTAHWCLLPLLVEKYYEHLKIEIHPALAMELDELRKFLSTKDLNNELKGEETRERTKQDMLKALNRENIQNKDSVPYQNFKELFPQIVQAIESMKRDDHKVISKPLRYYTAKIINASLICVQKLGIPAIPDTDCLICPSKDRETVCRIIGEEMHALTGVHCFVDGIRYQITTCF